jgi:hypothetical protein
MSDFLHFNEVVYKGLWFDVTFVLGLNAWRRASLRDCG